MGVMWYNLNLMLFSDMAARGSGLQRLPVLKGMTQLTPEQVNGNQWQQLCCKWEEGGDGAGRPQVPGPRLADSWVSFFFSINVQ